LHAHFERQLAARLLRFAVVGEHPNLFQEEATLALLRPLQKWLELEGQIGPMKVKPFPAGLSVSWIKSRPEFTGTIPVTDYEIRRNLPGIRALVHG
jgi:hypothetical protein